MMAKVQSENTKSQSFSSTLLAHFSQRLPPMIRRLSDVLSASNINKDKPLLGSVQRKQAAESKCSFLPSEIASKRSFPAALGACFTRRGSQLGAMDENVLPVSGEVVFQQLLFNRSLVYLLPR